MKTADIVQTDKGFYVTRRYCGQNKGMQFFPIKSSKNAAAKRAEQWAKEWTGE